MKNKNTSKTFFGIAILLAAVFLGGFFYIKNSLKALDGQGAEKTFHLKIEKGATAKKIAASLANEKIIKDEKIFYLLARFPKIAAAFTNESPEIFCVKSGVCDLKSSMDAAAIYKELSAGREELTSVSIPEGLTITKIAVHLDKAGV